jgi:hypothetical protein
MTDRNTSCIRPLALGLASLLFAVALAVAVTTGGVAGQSSTVDLVNSTAEVTNETQSVYADATAGDLNGTNASVYVNFYGIDSNGTETVLNQNTLTLSTNQTESVDYAFSNSERANYTDVRVQVRGPSESNLTVDWGVIGKISGGGGGVLGTGALGSTGVIAILAVVAALVLMRDD